MACNGQTFDKAKYPWLAEIFADGVLPNLNDNRFLEGSTTAKQQKEAGLPNITGSFDANVDDRDNAKTGAFYNTGRAYTGADGIDTGGVVGFNASRCSAIYGKSDTVQPKSYTVTYYVCYA